MTASLRSALSRAIDYAGVYPPARLPLSEAVAEYARLRGESGSWMLARFVCPAASVPELAALWPVADEVPLMVAAIGTGGGTPAALHERTIEDIAAIDAARASSGRRVVVDQFEVKLPASLLATPDQQRIADAISPLHDLLARALPASLLLAVEAPVAGAPAAVVQATIAGIAAHNRAAAAAGTVPVCLKVRCGGLDAAAVPTSAELAAVIAACRERHVAIKATQGLHHPFRRHDSATGAGTHGFVNLMAAAAFAGAAGLGTAEIEAVLGDADPAHFHFAEDALTWGEYRATIADLASGRRHGVLSFGSCSFADPRDDLAALGLL